MIFHKRVVVSVFLTIALLSQAGFALETVPGTADSASDSRSVASETMKPLGQTLPTGGLGKNAISAPLTQADSQIAAEKTDYVYKTDNETESLQNAISEYNRRYCPPNEPIVEISKGTIGILVEHRILKEHPKQTDDLVIRDGKVYRRAKREAQPLVERGETSGSLFGAFGVTVKSLDQKSPVGVGNKVVKADDMNMDEKRVMVKQVSGNYEEVEYAVPRVPAPVKAPPKKVSVKARSDIVRKQILELRQRVTTPITPNEAGTQP